MTNYSRSVLKSNGLRHPKIRLKKFGFSSKSVPANIAKKLPSQRCPNRFSSHFSTFRTNGPRSLLRVKAGTHSPFGEGSHTTAHTAKHGPSLPRPQRGLVLPAKLPPKEQLEKVDARQWRVSAFSGTATPLGCGNLFFCYSVDIFAPLPVWPTAGIFNQDY